jgi:NAD-dependent deacetylase
MWEDEKTRGLALKAGPPWNTKGTWEFYEWRRGLVSHCKPNAAHLTLVEMESYFDNFCVITQNVDGLHARAGSTPHTPLDSLPPYHTCGTALRPHVVQFGETLDPATINAAINASAHADLFFVIGTSAVVSPARELPLIALKKGTAVIEINRDPTPLTSLVTLSIRGKAAEILPQLWTELLEK